MGKRRPKQEKGGSETKARPRDRRGGRKSRRQVGGVEDLWHRILANDTLWLLLFFVVGSWCLAPEGVFTPELEVGGIASRDYLAPTELLVPDEETTLEHRQRARDSVPPVYDYAPSAAGEIDRQLGRLFAEGREVLSYTEGEKGLTEDVESNLRAALESASSIQLNEAQTKLLLKRQFSPELEEAMRALLDSVLRRGVVGNKALLLEHRLQGVTLRNLETGEESLELDLYDYRSHPEDVRGDLETAVRGWRGWSGSERRLLVDLLVANVSPNVYLNRAETSARQEAAAEAEEPLLKRIRKGQVVVRKGDVIDGAAARIWNDLVGRRRNVDLILPVLSNTLLLGLVALGLWLSLQKELRPRGQARPPIGGLLLLLILSLVAVKFGILVSTALSEAESSPIKSQISYFHAIPFAALALVTSLLFGRATALIVAVLFSVLVGRLFPEDAVWAATYCLAGSLAAIYSLDKLKQRSAVTRAGLVVGLVNVVTAMMLTAFLVDTSSAFGRIGFDALCSLAGGVLVAAITSFILPVLETLLSATTDIRLIELSDTNRTILRRLAFEAPGTFQHSLMVANLAKEGCEAIGANPVLAYTGGLYHDIGKILRPNYFVENQRGGENRHDRLSPSMSSLIVISHVKDGLQLAEEHRLPQPIKDAIAQHHGNRILTFFYKKAQEQCSASDVRENDYRYPGPKPQNKVMGVLMYADAVEAASRTLVHPSAAKLRSVVRAILDSCLEDGQLDQTDLTLGDLSQVSEAFLRVLENTYHRRVDYPGFQFNEAGSERAVPVAQGTSS